MTTETVSQELREMTRKDAEEYQARILQRLSQVKQTCAADCMGVSSSTVSRMVTDDLFRFCELLAALNLQVAPDDVVITTQAELDAFETFAFRYMESRQRKRGRL
ncbi:lambda phage CII family protein [Oxalobacter formigenes]|uniref:CII family transcriptional regulator n=1 Tax=Oxalobacter formigenes TaxID=847 RepID=UPI0022AFDEB3|nr:CII family transcriptional regulator [Oxalobacter formigenes]WAW01195.1 lambda phage CII family protein [Oxalobacter formigenes]WAW03523.1 lambda phage CII family protein [Oxalobacter formigenes]